MFVTCFIWIQSKWRPRFIFDWNVAAELSQYGIYLLGFSSLNYWLRNLDNLLVGKFLGAHQLGVYGRAYQVMLLPITNVAAVIGKAMFPALTQIQNDIPRFRRSYISATCAIAFVTFPLMIGIAVLSEPLIFVAFGSKWAEVIPILRVLSLVGLLQSVIHPVGWVFNALGETKAQFKLGILGALPFVIAIGIGIQFGVLGVAYGYAVWAIFDGWLSLHIAGKYIDMTISSFLLGIARISFMAAIMGIIVFCLDSTFFYVWSPPARLFTGISVGVGSYFALSLLMKDETFAELARLFFTFFRSAK